MKKFITIAIATIFAALIWANYNNITQHSWDEYDYVDTCTAKYAVVHDWSGRCGLYNLETHRNITELEFRDIFYSEDAQKDTGLDNPIFYCYKGRQEGMLCVTNDDEIITIMNDDPKQFYDIDSCETVDKQIQNFCGKELKKNMAALDSVQYAEVLVMDTKTGELKAWVAMKDETGKGKFTEAKPRKHECSMLPLRDIAAFYAIDEAKLSIEDTIDIGDGVDSIAGIRIQDDKCIKSGGSKLTYREAFKQHSDIAFAHAFYSADSVGFKRMWLETERSPREVSVLKYATIYSAIANDGMLPHAYGQKGSIWLSAGKKGVISSEQLTTCREMLKVMLQEDGVGSEWTTHKVNISGDYTVNANCCPTLYDDNANEIDRWRDGGFLNYEQIMFNGYLPSDNPRYTICVVLDKKGKQVNGQAISYVVNKVAEYLNKH